MFRLYLGSGFEIPRSVPKQYYLTSCFLKINRIYKFIVRICVYKMKVKHHITYKFANPETEYL